MNDQVNVSVSCYLTSKISSPDLRGVSRVLQWRHRCNDDLDDHYHNNKVDLKTRNLVIENSCRSGAWENRDDKLLLWYIKHSRQCFIRISKHLVFRQKYSAARRIFNFLLGVWISRWNNSISCLMYYMSDNEHCRLRRTLPSHVISSTLELAMLQ